MDNKQQARELHAISQQHGMGGLVKGFFEKTPFTLNDMENGQKMPLPEIGAESRQIETPESIMQKGFECFFGAKECFEKAAIEYDKVAGYETLNGENVKSAIRFMARAYDEISAIWENDINI